MKKTIRLTENDVQRMVKDILSERLGVPDNISETAEILINDMIKEFSRNTELLDSNETTENVTFRRNYKIADYEFDTINIGIQARPLQDENSKPVITQLQNLTPNDVKNYKLVRVDDLSELNINIVIGVGSQWRVSDVAEILNSEKDKWTSVLSHELHHSYHNYKTPSMAGHIKTEYQANQSVQIGGIPPIRYFLFYSYYINSIEDIVRPSEMYSSLRTKNITKSQFKKFFEEHEIIDTLKQIRNFKLDAMISELHNYIPNIDEIFDIIENDKKFPIKINRGYNDDEKINNFLDMIFKLLVESKKTTYFQFLMSTVNPVEIMRAVFAGPEDEDIFKDRDRMMEKYVKKVEKYKNYRDFFVNEEKKFNFVADRTIKKLSKLYDMSKDDNESSIVNWDLHHKINKTQEKTLEELKRLFREGKIKLPSDKPKDKKK